MDRKKVLDTTRGLLYWRAIARMGAFALLGCWMILFFIFYFSLVAFFDYDSYLLSGILTSIIIIICAFFVYNHLKKKACLFEEQWKKLEESKKR